MKEFAILNEQEYSTFYASHPLRNFMNAPEAMKQKALGSIPYEYAGVRENGMLLCATPLCYFPFMKVFRMCYAQRGFLADYTDRETLAFFSSSLKQYLKKKRVVYLLADPNVLYRERDIDGELVENGFDNSYVLDAMTEAGFTHQGFSRNYGTFAMVNWMFSLYLNGKDEDTVLKEMHQQTRWSLNRTLKQGIQVRELGEDELDIFLNMEEATAKRRGFEMRDRNFYRNQYKAYGEHARLLLAYLDLDVFDASNAKEYVQITANIQENDAKLAETPGSKKYTKKQKVLQEALDLNAKKQQESSELRAAYGSVLNMAASWFMVYDNEITYLYSAADDTFRRYYAPYAVQWHMIRYALEHHIPRYNFYGISGDFREEAEDYGVYEFKRGFGGQTEELVGDFILPVKPFLYSLYRRLRSR